MLLLLLFGAALLILAAAIVVLFAMLGELASRVPPPGATRRDPTLRPIKEARLGTVPLTWPTGLAPANGDGRAVVLVLSTVCAACSDIAAQLTEGPGHGDWRELAVVVSAGNRQAGEQFIAQHQLSAFRHYVDPGGDWVAGQFGVRISPSALVFHSGRLEAAYLFNDVAALRATVARQATVGRDRKESG